jgi:glycoside/pentoside/hexuronide:cation symporter, GPH family
MSATTETGKLSAVTKWAYGGGDLGASIVTAINGFFLNAFLLNVAGLRPGLVAIIFLTVKIWDSVNDPIIGALTDRTRTRWGRRRPWLLFGAIPFGVAFWLNWIVPPLDDFGKFWYYLVIGILLDSAFTAVNVPYGALTPELTRDYDERTSLNTYRFGFSILGGVIAASLHNVIAGAFPSIRTGYAVSAAIWAVFLVIPNIITFAFTREKDFVEEDVKGPGFLEGLKIALSNRAFILVTLIYLLSWLAIQFVQGNLFLYVDGWIHGAEYFPIMILAVQVSAFVFLLIWARISERIGKQRVYYYGMGFWVLVCIGLFFVQPGQIVLLIIIAILAAVGVSVGYLVPWSMLPDVIELDELQTGQRREGIFYGFFYFLQKMGLSLGLAASNLVLEATGYIKPAVEGATLPPQPEAVYLALRSFVSLVPAAILLLSFFVVRAYPITREKHAEMLAELEKRRAAAS